MEWYTTSELSLIQIVDMVITMHLFGISLALFNRPNDSHDSNAQNNSTLHDLIPSIVIAVVFYLGIFCSSLLWQNKVLEKAPVIKIVQVTKEENSDHWSLSPRYIYHITDFKNIVYKVETEKSVDFTKYTVKVPYDRVFGEYIYLFKNGKYVKDYMLAETPCKTVNQ